MHERFLLHFGIKLKKVADHSERKKKKMNKTFRCSKLKRTSWPNAEENFVFVTNFKYVKLILIFVLKQGDPCKCYIYNRWQLCPPVQPPGTLHNICGLVKAWSLRIDYSISGAKAAAMMVSPVVSSPRANL